MSAVRVVPLKVNCRWCGAEIPVDLDSVPAEVKDASELFEDLATKAAALHEGVCPCTCTEVDGRQDGRLINAGCPVHGEDAMRTREEEHAQAMREANE